MEVRHDRPRSLGVERLIYLSDDALPTATVAPKLSVLELAAGIFGAALALGAVKITVDGRSHGQVLGALTALYVGAQWYKSR